MPDIKFIGGVWDGQVRQIVGYPPNILVPIHTPMQLSSVTEPPTFVKQKVFEYTLKHFNDDKGERFFLYAPEGMSYAELIQKLIDGYTP